MEAACTPDSYESGAGDNTQANAAPILLDVIQQHNFCGTGDTDWVTFTAEQGQTYLIFAWPDAGSAAAPVLSLYDALGAAAPGSQTLTPAGLGQPGAIRWTAPASGVYALKVQSLDPTVAGTGVSYELGVALEHPAFLPFIRNAGPG